MNKIIGVVLVTIVAFFGLGFYLLTDTMTGTDVEEIRDHGDELKAFEVGPSEVLQKMQGDRIPTVLDLRTLEAYQQMHIQGALLLPAQELSQKTLTQIGLGPSEKDTEIILYDRSGSASKTAYQMMTALGYTKVKSVSGGMTHWKEDAFPMLEEGEYVGPRVSEGVQESIFTKGPKISLEDDWYDFGVIPQYGGVVEKTFTITNTGIETLEIGDLTTSCSCASADISSTDIEPKEDAVLTVYFDPDFHTEPEDVFTRTVFIPTNDPYTPEAEVTIQVDIDEGV